MKFIRLSIHNTWPEVSGIEAWNAIATFVLNHSLFNVITIIIKTGKCYFTDINECAGSHDCSHGCSNTNGSFQCTCPEGLFLSDDRRNCNGDYIQCL